MRVQSSTWFRAAGGWLLLMAVGHSYGHYVGYYRIGDFSVGRRALYELMRAYETGKDVSDPFEPDMWTVITAFSLGLAMLFVFAALVTFMVAGLRDERFKKSFALFSSLFWIAGVAVWMYLSPMIQPLVIGTVASLLYAAAWIRLR